MNHDCVSCGFYRDVDEAVVYSFYILTSILDREWARIQMKSPPRRTIKLYFIVIMVIG